MRVLIGLAALAALSSNVSALALVGSGATTGSAPPATTPSGQTALMKVAIRTTSPGGANPSSITPGFNEADWLNTLSYSITVANPITAINFHLSTNLYTAQVQYRFGGADYQSIITAWNNANPTHVPLTTANYWCDMCTGANSANGPVRCDTYSGPTIAGIIPSSNVGGPSGNTPPGGYNCALMERDYLFSGLVAQLANNQGAFGIVNSLSFQLFDTQKDPASNVSSYSFIVLRSAPAIVGDPQISGMQGQDFQVHGMPDEIFNMISYPNLQVNARFVYLSAGACHDNFTACFAHPGTYISEEGIRLGRDKIHVQAGSFKKGLTVSVNGNKVTEQITKVKLGSVHVQSHRRVIITTPIMSIAISNSDKFLNQETSLFDQKLLALGAERRVLLVGDSFHPEVPLHGLQGQTWRNVEYPSGLDYEGSISDYHVTDGNLFGSKFVFNQYKQ